jgi:hypothetical protein
MKITSTIWAFFIENKEMNLFSSNEFRVQAPSNPIILFFIFIIFVNKIPPPPPKKNFYIYIIITMKGYTIFFRKILFFKKQ